MSQLSITNNKDAIRKIENTINIYNEAITIITSKNKTAQTTEISTLLNTEIDSLKDLKKRLEDMNTEITRKLEEKAREEKEKRENK